MAFASTAPPAEQARVPLYLAVTGTLLAATILLARVAADRGAPMLWLLVAASAAAGLAELGLAAAAGQLRGVSGRVLAYSAGSGLLMAAPSALAWLSVAHAGAGYVAFMHALPILLTWVIARLIGLEGRSPRRLAAVLLGLAGGGSLAVGKLVGAAPGSASWTLAATAIPVFLALGNIYRTRFWPAGAAPILLAGLMLLATALALLPVALLAQPGAAPRLLAPGVWPVGLAITAAWTLQYVTYFRLQHAGGPVMLSLIGPVAGIVGPLGAVLLLGERMPAILPLSAALTFAGVWLMLRRR